MPDSTDPKHVSRLITPGVIVTFFALVMSACVLSVVVWKALDTKATTLERGKADIQNLAHSLVEHAAHTIQAVDIAMGGMVELLKYRKPLPERFNRYLADTVSALPQIREIGVLDSDGGWEYSSFPDTPKHNNSDRSYFIHHRDTPGTTLTISEPLQSRLTGRSTIILSKRISKQDGTFGGVLTAAIDTDYFNGFYGTFQLGPDAGISLLRNDGIVLVHWPMSDAAKDLSKSELFTKQLKLSPVGYYRITSLFDGIVKLFGYEETSRYPIVVTVAQSENNLMASWWSTLRTDAIVAGVLLCTVVLLAALLSAQFGFRLKTERLLRDREARYRLLADNIADVVILYDGRGTLLYVSPSVDSMLGLRAQDLIGKSCFDLVHPGDKERVKAANRQLGGPASVSTVMFRLHRLDQSVVWVETNFKLASERDNPEQREFVGVLRDVTQRKAMEDELTSLNARLAQLATTDGLTGLYNRRTFDGFLRREYEARETISVLLFDIDNFKGYNDTYGHQAGDECLRTVAKTIAGATTDTAGISARYGGEEFAVILPDVTEQDALKVSEWVRLTIRALGIPNSASSRKYVTVSAGVSTKTRSTFNDAALVGDADLALYEAKRLGRNRSVTSNSLNREYVDAVPLQFVLDTET